MLFCFDYDGVIADSFDKLLNICKESQATVGCGRVPVEDDFRLTENLTFDHMARQLGIPADQVGIFAKQVFSRLGDGPDRVFEGIPEVMRMLSKTHVLCVVTANTAAKVSATLDDAGIHDCFSRIFGGDEGLSKYEQIDQARTLFDVPAAETVMVGDTVGDLRMARKAGVHAVAVTWGYQDERFLATEQPDGFARTPDDLLRVTMQLGASPTNERKTHP